MQYQKNKIKYYIKDSEGRKFFLNDDSNKILNEFNHVKQIVDKVNHKIPFKIDFKVPYSHERDKTV